jgi:hypothetical protein
LTALHDAFEDGQLRFTASLHALSDPHGFADHLQPARKTEWVVYAKSPFAGPQQVLDYVGRYTHRVAVESVSTLRPSERPWRERASWRSMMVGTRVPRPARGRPASHEEGSMLLRIGQGPSTEEIANAVHGKLQGVLPTADEIAKAVKKEVESLITAVKTAVESVSKGLNNLTAKTEKLWTSTEQSVQHAETAVAHTVAIAGSLAHSYAEWEQQHESTFKAKLTHFFDGIVAIAEQVPSIFLSIRIDVDKPLHDFIVRQINLTPGVVLWGLDKSLSKASVHSPAGGVTPWQDLPDEVVAFLKRLPPLEGPPEVVCPRIMAPGMPLPWEVHRARTLVRLLVEAARVAQELTPKDLSVTAVAVAGGGTEVAGHPSKWPFLFAQEIVTLADWAMTRYLEEYAACHN